MKKYTLKTEHKGLPESTKELIREGLKIRCKIKKAQDRLSEIEGELSDIATSNKKRVDTHINLTIPEDLREGTLVPGVNITWSKRYQVSLSKATKLKKKLGETWSDFFTEKTTITRTRQHNSNLEGVVDVALAKKIKEAVDVVISKNPTLKWSH